MDELVTVRQDIDHLVRPYNYERLPGDATVDDLKARMHECLKPFTMVMKLWIDEFLPNINFHMSSWENIK